MLNPGVTPRTSHLTSVLKLALVHSPQPKPDKDPCKYPGCGVKQNGGTTACDNCPWLGVPSG